MTKRLPLLLILLAVGAVCLLAGSVLLDLAGEGGAGDDDASYLDTGDLLDADGESGVEPEAGPGLATTGHALPDGDSTGKAGAAGSLGDGTGTSRSDAEVGFGGKVVDKDGRPAAGITIAMKGPGGFYKFKTGADGEFKHAAAPGRYALFFDGGESGGLLLRSWMLDGSATEELEFALRAPATVAVQVTRGPDPVPDVAVVLVSRELGELNEHDGLTDAEGKATFEDLPSGRYTVTAQVPDGPKVEHGLYARPSVTNAVRVKVPGGVTLKGTVRAGKDGPGVGGAVMTLKTQARGSHGIFETVFETKPDGTYEVMVPQGNVRDFTVEAEGHATWPVPRARGGVLKSLRGLRKTKPVTRNVTLASGAVLSGVVLTEEKTPVPGLALRFAMRRGPTVTVTTQPDGTYTAANMVPGSYELQISTPAWFPITGQPLRVGIPGGSQPKPTTYDITVVGARRLKGVVVDGAGKGVGGARVWIIGGGRVLRSARNAGRVLEVFTSTTGGWAIGDIPPDKNVTVRAAMGLLEADPVHAPWKTPSPQPLTLKLQGTGEIRGRVVDLDTRTDIRGVRVRITPDPYDGRTGRTVSSGAKGEFHVQGMLPGAYKFLPYKKGYLVAQPDSATVTRAGAVSIELRLDPGMVFQGVVVNEAGQPIRYTRVTLRGTPDGKEKAIARGVSTDARGRFNVTGLLRGTYALTAYRRGYAVVRMPDRRGSQRGMRLVLRKR